MLFFTCLVPACMMIILEYATAADIRLEVNPPFINPGLTRSLKLRCSVFDDPTPTDSRSIARQSDSTQTDSEVDIFHIISLIITRIQPDSGLNETVATISTFGSAQTQVDAGILKAEGTTSASSGEQGYLELTWDHPVEYQAGVYVCEIYALNSQLHSEYLTVAIEVSSSDPSLEDITTLIANDDRYITDLENEVGMLKARITSLEYEAANRTNACESKLQSLNSEIQQLQVISNNIKGNHIQTGTVNCTDDDHNAYSQVFPTPYTSPPTVLLLLNNFMFGGSYANSYLRPSIDSISSTRVTIRCSSSHMHAYVVTWIAFDN